MATKDQFIDAVIDAKRRGWAAIRTSSGYVLNAPSNTVEIPTPDSTPANWWPAPTYNRLRQLSFALIEGKISGPFVRETATPWVQGRDIKVSLVKAIDFLKTE